MDSARVPFPKPGLVRIEVGFRQKSFSKAKPCPNQGWIQPEFLFKSQALSESRLDSARVPFPKPGLVRIKDGFSQSSFSKARPCPNQEWIQTEFHFQAKPCPNQGWIQPEFLFQSQALSE
ncbi:hypothetical protein QFZ87_000846 [Bacillus sp. SLBN-46]|uniref:hypothetical protein n=1 Tax=Bacillus sp. SLBN-46 TaxID=3042283 RepID=UPI0028629DEB|nr:hypothetical protein [Bacillus sp. SLBN-46]MDR6121249.1 hypothetical protein [Bacillus sp. SLBN-46]